MAKEMKLCRQKGGAKEDKVQQIKITNIVKIALEVGGMVDVTAKIQKIIKDRAN